MNDMTTAQKRGEVLPAEATRGGQYFTPQVDICETDKELVLYADLPGVRPGDVELRYENGELTLHGKTARQEAKGPFLLYEYGGGDFYRVFSVHESIDSGKISAECKNGVLVVRLPKVAEQQPRQITVRGG